MNLIPKRKTRILVIHQDDAVLRSVSEILAPAGYHVVTAEEAVEGLHAARDPSVDVCLVDLQMPYLSGPALLEAITKERPEVEVVMLAAPAAVKAAAQAVEAGAYEYLIEPFADPETLLRTVARAAERRTLRDETRTLREALSARNQFEELIGQSARMREVFKQVETLGHSSAAVLIEGEPGTGKELVARAIHVGSDRRNAPFVAVNCSALSDVLLETELFGAGDKRGLFEAADGGTLFLDEIGHIPTATQVRLLRVLQEGEIKRGAEMLKVDVRVIAATHAVPGSSNGAGRFRDDLYYRLNVVSVALPPLRERPEDVPLLAQHFVTLFARRMGKKVTSISAPALAALSAGRWAGNVRELQNVIERAVVVAQRECIDAEDLPAVTREPARDGGEAEVSSLAHLPYADAKRLAMRAFERRYLSALLDQHGNNISSAARAAGVDRSNFRRLLKQYEVGGRSMQKVESGDLDVAPPPRLPRIIASA